MKKNTYKITKKKYKELGIDKLDKLNTWYEKHLKELEEEHNKCFIDFLFAQYEYRKLK